MNFVRSLFDTSNFPPRWSCGDWSPQLGWLHIVSDLTIAAAYFAIPVSLAIVAFRRRDFPFGALLALFVAFILACGATHLLEAVIFWEPVYRLSGVLKFATAGVSIVTAIVLIRSLPSLLALPSLRGVVSQQREELDRVHRLQVELAEARDTLERRTAEMTQRLRRKARAFTAARVVACQWRADTGEVLWELGFAETSQAAGLPYTGALRSIDQLLIQADADRLSALARAATPENPTLDFEGSLRIEPERKLRLSASREFEVNGQPPTMIGMFRFL